MLQVKEEVLVNEEMADETQGFFRFNFVEPIGAKLGIEEVAGMKVNLNKTEIEIKDFSAGGLAFESELDFPVREDVLYSFRTTILDKEVELKGSLCRQDETKGNKFEYGLAFHFDQQKEKIQRELVALVNSLQVKYRHGRKKGYEFKESVLS